MRRFLDQHYEDRIFLAEVTQTPTDIRAYFGEGDECHMAYHFPLVPRLFLALCQEERTSITDMLQQTPALPYDYQWALFLRNHDAMGVKMLTEAERVAAHGAVPGSYVSEALRALGRLDADEGDHASATRRLKKAIELARRVLDPWAERRAADELERLTNA